MHKKLPKKILKDIFGGEVTLTCDKPQFQKSQSFNEDDGDGRQAFIKSCAEA